MYNVNLINYLDSVILDDPKKINTLEINYFHTDINFLINQLFHTDFNRCYQSIKELMKSPLDKVLYYLNKKKDTLKTVSYFLYLGQLI